MHNFSLSLTFALFILFDAFTHSLHNSSSSIHEFCKTREFRSKKINFLPFFSRAVKTFWHTCLKIFFKKKTNMKGYAHKGFLFHYIYGLPSHTEVFFKHFCVGETKTET